MSTQLNISKISRPNSNPSKVFTSEKGNFSLWDVLISDTLRSLLASMHHYSLINARILSGKFHVDQLEISSLMILTLTVTTISALICCSSSTEFLSAPRRDVELNVAQRNRTF
jgi:hypothetical protein